MKRLCIALILAAASIAYSKTIYVSNSGDNSDGTTWAKAFTNTIHAVNNASSLDTILLTNGTYLHGTNVIFIGGRWASQAVTNINVNNLTIESVNGPEVTKVIGTSPNGLMWIYSNTTVRGLGFFDMSKDQYGAITVYKTAEVTIEKCIFSNYVVVGGGRIEGAVCLGSGAGSPKTTIRDCKFYRCGGTAELSEGGAIFSDWSLGAFCTTLVINCYFEGNYSGKSGAIGAYAAGAALAVTNCAFVNNSNTTGNAGYSADVRFAKGGVWNSISIGGKGNNSMAGTVARQTTIIGGDYSTGTATLSNSVAAYNTKANTHTNEFRSSAWLTAYGWSTNNTGKNFPYSEMPDGTNGFRPLGGSEIRKQNLGALKWRPTKGRETRRIITGSK